MLLTREHFDELVILAKLRNRPSFSCILYSKFRSNKSTVIMTDDRVYFYDPKSSMILQRGYYNTDRMNQCLASGDFYSGAEYYQYFSISTQVPTLDQFFNYINLAFNSAIVTQEEHLRAFQGAEIILYD